MNKAITLKNLLYLLFAALVLAPVTGELWHFNIFGFGLLPSDLLIPLIFLVWMIDKIHNDRALRVGKTGRMVIVFIFVMLITFFINCFRFPVKEMIIAFTGLARYGMYLVLSLITFDLLYRDKNKAFRQILTVTMIVSFLLICIFGFLQLVYFPSFEELGLQLQGWDPHIGRLLSTWFDPNFIGGYLAFLLGPIIGLMLYFRTSGKQKWFYIMAIISAIGLYAEYLTFSRSGYLALMTVLFLLALLRSRKLLIGSLLIGILAFSFSPRVQQRGEEAVGSAKALLGLDSQRPLDPTAELRVWSWSFAEEIIDENPWVGIGYNRYAYEINKRGHGLLSDHSASGSDSSLLTIWATSGIFGLLVYLGIGFSATVITLKRIWKKHDIRSFLDSGFLAGFAGMMIHSVFVNSLLFAPMMVYMMIALGMIDEKNG